MTDNRTGKDLGDINRKKERGVEERAVSCRIGIDLGGTNMAAGLVDEDYHVIFQHSIKTRANGTPEQIADDMEGLVSLLCERAESEGRKVISVGIGIPGSVNNDGIVEDANNIGFYNVPFRTMMEERLSLPVETVNDARAAAMGEYLAGAGTGSKVFQMVTIGTGIGGALIIDGRVVSGCNGAAGEIGHMVIVRDGLPCSCGRRGCYEVYASASALSARMCEAVKKQPGRARLLLQLCGQDIRQPGRWNTVPLSGQDAGQPSRQDTVQLCNQDAGQPSRQDTVQLCSQDAEQPSRQDTVQLCNQDARQLNGRHLFMAAEQGDALAEELLVEHVDYLAEGIANLINMLQPDILCVGGGMSEQGDALMVPLRNAVAEKIYSRHSAVQTRLVAAKLGNAAGIIGAAYSGR